MKATARVDPDDVSYRGGVRLSDLRRKRQWHKFTDSADGRAMWRAFLEAHRGDEEAALGELVAAVFDADLL